MNKAQESLEENKAAILAALPEEFHADFEKQMKEAPEADSGLTGEAAVEAIKAELKENPEVDESAAAAELTDIAAPEVPAPASEAEVEAEKASLLKEVEAEVENKNSEA